MQFKQTKIKPSFGHTCNYLISLYILFNTNFTIESIISLASEHLENTLITSYKWGSMVCFHVQMATLDLHSYLTCFTSIFVRRRLQVFRMGWTVALRCLSARIFSLDFRSAASILSPIFHTLTIFYDAINIHWNV